MSFLAERDIWFFHCLSQNYRQTNPSPLPRHTHTHTLSLSLCCIHLPKCQFNLSPGSSFFYLSTTHLLFFFIRFQSVQWVFMVNHLQVQLSRSCAYQIWGTDDGLGERSILVHLGYLWMQIRITEWSLIYGINTGRTSVFTAYRASHSDCFAVESILNNPLFKQ